MAANRPVSTSFSPVIHLALSTHPSLRHPPYLVDDDRSFFIFFFFVSPLSEFPFYSYLAGCSWLRVFSSLYPHFPSVGRSSSRVRSQTFRPPNFVFRAAAAGTFYRPAAAVLPPAHTDTRWRRQKSGPPSSYSRLFFHFGKLDGFIFTAAIISNISTLLPRKVRAAAAAVWGA